MKPQALTESHAAEDSSNLDGAGARSLRVFRGDVCRMDRDYRFGYVRLDDGVGTFIFVTGRAMTHRAAARLHIGSRVEVCLDEQNRVERMLLV